MGMVNGGLRQRPAGSLSRRFPKRYMRLASGVLFSWLPLARTTAQSWAIRIGGISVGQASGKALIASPMHAGSLDKKPLDGQASIASALRTVATEQAGVAALAEALENGLAGPFAQAVDIVSKIEGRVIVTGVGKSGHIGSKIAATLASTGTPAFFVHPVRSQSWRSRHDRQGRRHHRHVVVGREQGTQRHRRLFQALLHSADRDHRRRDVGAGARGGCGAAAAAGPGGLPARPGADDVDTAATGDGRCAGDRACSRRAASRRTISAPFTPAASSAPT